MTKQVFIIGMPRSGTKLLRSLLNGHPRISILTEETEFLPYWKKKWTAWGGAELLGEYDHFVKFYSKITRFPYFLSKSGKGPIITAETWYNLCDSYTIAGVFEALARHDANAGKDMIWGDKSPGYIRHIPLLKELFPEAKIIHIIRDVRDYCLSINKAWGKNMLRAAQRWSNDVSKARNDGHSLKDDYLELKYEDLLESPDIQLKQICSFLHIEYDPEMLHLKNPTENIGDARNKQWIFKKNKYKYIDMMDPARRHQIERIAFRVLLQSGYPTRSFPREKKLSALENRIYQLADGFNLIRMKRRYTGQGALQIVHYYLKAYRQSSVKRQLDK